MKQLLKIISVIAVFSFYLTPAFADGSYTRKLRLDAKSLQQVLQAEEKILADDISTTATLRLEKPILATVSVPYIGTVRIVLNKLRRFQNDQLRVVGNNGVSYEEYTPPVFLQGYVKKGGERLGPVAGSYKNRRLTITLLLDKKGRPIDLIADPDSGESAYVNLRYTRLPSHRAKQIVCNHAEHKQGFNLQAIYESAIINAAATKQLDLELDGDKELYEANGSSTTDATSSMLAVTNAVDTIYQRDLGVMINVSETTVYTGNTPYSSTNASTLLSQINNNSTGGSQDLTHLITGKDVCAVVEGSSACNSGVAGLAWVGVTCRSSTNNTGLSERFNNDTISALITAHEIGHNLNGSHSSPSNNTIMDASLGGGTDSRFSSASISEIGTFISNFGSCLDLISGDVSAASSIKKKKGKITLTASYDQDRTGCTVNFSLGNKSDFSKKTNDLGTFDVSGTSTQITGKQTKALKKGKVYVRTTLTCGDNEYTSSSTNMKGARKISKSGKTTKAGKWMKLKKITQLS